MIGRKRIVLVEKFNFKNIENNKFSKMLGLPLFFQMDFYKKNRFILELESSKNTIKPELIQGFEVFELKEEKTIEIKTIMHINTWIEDLKLMNIVKINFLDTLGNSIRFFDFDIIYIGYKMSCNYSAEGLMAPTFIYKIID